MCRKHKGPEQWAPSATGRTLHVHRMAHVFSLVLQDLGPKFKCDRDFLGAISDLISFVTSSPKRVSLFQALQLEDENMNLRKFCTSHNWRERVAREGNRGWAVWRQTVRANPPPTPREIQKLSAYAVGRRRSMGTQDTPRLRCSSSEVSFFFCFFSISFLYRSS